MLKLHSWTRIAAILVFGDRGLLCFTKVRKSGSCETTETKNQFKAGEVWAGASLAYTSNTCKRWNNLDLLL